MKKLPLLVASFLSILSVGSALADPVPVVAVNREIGLSMAGLFDDIVRGYSDSYRTPPAGSYAGYQELYHGRARRTGWVPGFQADASGMFSLGHVNNLYASARFLLGQGSQNYKSSESYESNYDPYSTRSSGGNRASRTTYTRGEIGKGFLLLHDRFLLTPFVQGGYLTYGTTSFSGANAFFVGAGLNGDYALTERLVVRGRFGWAQLLDSWYAPRSAGSNPRWEGGLGFDYRVTHSLHLTGGGDYAYTNYGHATRRRVWSYDAREVEAASAFQNGLTLHAGLAYQY